MRPFQILIAGRSASELDQLKAMLIGTPNARVATLQLDSDWMSVFHQVVPEADILIYCLDQEPERDLAQLTHWAPAQRPALLLIGSFDTGQPRLMRLAMQAGARDFLDRPVSVKDLADEISRIRRERQGEALARNDMTVFVGPKSGVGAATLAAGVAHVLAAKHELPTLLLDLNYQFGSQYLNLDLHPDKGLRELMEAIEGLDNLALGGYVMRHRSGLHLLGALPAQILLPSDMEESRLNRLFDALEQAYNQIVINIPCLIDPLFNLVAERATRILLVLQQDFQNIRNGQKLYRILKEELHVPPDRISLIVNRYEKNNSITIDYIREGLRLDPVAIIPSDFRAVNSAANLGLPLVEHSPESPVSRALLELADWISGQEPEEAIPSGLWKRFTAWIAGGGDGS